jgi:hypothetical protein
VPPSDRTGSLKIADTKNVVRAIAACVLLVCLAAPPPAFGQEAIQRVDVQVVYDGPPPHAIVQNRVLAAVSGVAERLLLGRALDAARQLQPRLAETFIEVLGRVVTGYAVTSATADVGPVTAVVIRLRPQGEVIRDPAIRFDLREVPERLRPQVTGLLRSADAQIRVLPAGLPAAADWAVALLEEEARAIVERDLAGYTAAVVFTPTPAVVEAAVRPRDSRVIRNVGVQFRSTTLPNLLMDQHTPAVTSLSAFLRGVPVAFAMAHTDALERIITEELAAYPPIQQYHIVARVALQVGETTFVTVVADSLSYRASVEAHLNIGVGAPGPSLVARAGRFITPGIDTFVEFRLVPNTLSLDWDLGAGLSLGPATSVGLSYTVPTSAVSIWTSVGLTPDLTLRGTWDTTAQTFEAAVRYRLNAFIAWEVVGVPGQIWVRLVSNL